MPVIKRYPNRKLYDTEAKSYVTLDQITQLIRNGEEIQVVDHESGEDLTNLTLTQIILEQEKKSSDGFVPRVLLTGLIRTGGDTLEQMRRSLPSWPAGRESVLEEQARQAVEQGRQLIDALQALLRLDHRMEELLHLLNLPSQRDVEQLQERIDGLNARLEELMDEPNGHPDERRREQDSGETGTGIKGQT
jgi:polyhydroxyalkanoate synthesis repressor PhaR